MCATDQLVTDLKGHLQWKIELLLYCRPSIIIIVRT